MIYPVNIYIMHIYACIYVYTFVAARGTCIYSVRSCESPIRRLYGDIAGERLGIGEGGLWNKVAIRRWAPRCYDL